MLTRNDLPEGPNEDQEFTEVFVEILSFSDNALLVSDGSTEAWIPRSQIRDVEEDYEVGQDVCLEIPAWLAEESGLE